MDADGVQLVLGARVSQCASDRNELVADIEAIPEAFYSLNLVSAFSRPHQGAAITDQMFVLVRNVD